MGIYKLNKCDRLNEFNDFLARVTVDIESEGRNFYVIDDKDKRYDFKMNEIAYRFKKCVENSIDDQILVKELSEKIDVLNFTATNTVDERIKEHGGEEIFRLRQFFGNLWFSFTHCGFNKQDVLDGIKDHQIRGRVDLTKETINDQDENGNTALHRLLLEDKRHKNLHRDVNEMLMSGADPSLLNKTGKNCVDLAFKIALDSRNYTPLRVLFCLLRPEFLVAIIARNYRATLAEELKIELAKIVKNRMKSCVLVLDALSSAAVKKDFFEIFFKHAYLQHRPIGESMIAYDFTVNPTLVDGSGNNMLHYGAMFLSDVADIEKLCSDDDPRGQIGNLTVKNVDEMLPVNLAKDPAIIAFLKDYK